MAKPTTYKGSSVAIFLEDTDAPGQFIRYCGLNNHSIQFSKNTKEVLVPDCDDPELPAWIERGVESLDFSGSGDGILAAEALPNWWAAFNTTDNINARIYVGEQTDTTNGYYWSGKIHVTGFEVTGTLGEKANASVSVVSDGEMILTKVA